MTPGASVEADFIASDSVKTVLTSFLEAHNSVVMLQMSI